VGRSCNVDAAANRPRRIQAGVSHLPAAETLIFGLSSREGKLCAAISCAIEIGEICVGDSH
jgi:hypothetical protein